MEKSLFAEKIANFASAHELWQTETRLLVALSGGADSVALLRVLCELGIPLLAAHCNFHLRGEESNRDEMFVKRLCEVNGIELRIEHFDTLAFAKEKGISIEMAARDLRYSWFASLCDSNGLTLAVAHHRNDSIETFLLNALRGTGIAGLQGIKSRTQFAGKYCVVRPLLCVDRSEILQYLAEMGQDYVTDSTNLENDAKRNRIRNVVWPVMEQNFPDAETTLDATIANLTRNASLYDELIKKTASGIISHIGSRTVVDCDNLLKFDNPSTLLFELVREYGFNHQQCCDILAAIVSGKGLGKHVMAGHCTMSVAHDGLEIFTDDVEEEILINFNEDVDQNFLSVSQSARPFDRKMVDGKSVIALNNGVLQCKHVVLRHWHRGDRMKPFGLKGSKLVSDLFADFKFSEGEKQRAWLLEADGEILWILGYRASSGYTVPQGSNDYLLIRYKQS